jgi:hypothetical protein
MAQAQLPIKLELEDWSIDQGYVAKIKVGIHKITDIELVKLGNALGVSVAWLVGEEE